MKFMKIYNKYLNKKLDNFSCVEFILMIFFLRCRCNNANNANNALIYPLIKLFYSLSILKFSYISNIIWIYMCVVSYNATTQFKNLL